MFAGPPMPSTKNKEDDTVLSELHLDVTLQFKVQEYFDKANNTVFIWYKRNTSLQTDGSKYIISFFRYQSTLVIRKITISDFGQYRVYVRNSYGEYIHTFELIQKGKMHIPLLYIYFICQNALSVCLISLITIFS